MDEEIRSGLLVRYPDTKLNCGEQLDYLFREWSERLPNSLRVTDTVEYTFWTPNRNLYLTDIREGLKPWWKNSYPANTFIELHVRPDGRPWGNALIAIEAIALIGNQADNRQSHFLSGGTIIGHAKLLRFEDRDELFFSGVVALTETAAGLEILSPNDLIGQVRVCIDKINEVCGKAAIPKSAIDLIEVFLPRRHYPFASTIVEMLWRKFRAPQISCRQVDGLFMDGLLVEIRPHAVVWK
ncbi:MAG: RidA family protein [Patescibacteria group bacterium]